MECAFGESRGSWGKCSLTPTPAGDVTQSWAPQEHRPPPFSPDTHVSAQSWRTERPECLSRPSPGNVSFVLLFRVRYLTGMSQAKPCTEESRSESRRSLPLGAQSPVRAAGRLAGRKL